MKKIALIVALIITSHCINAQAKSANAEETFTTFFKKFNEDKSFQISRVVFPLAVKMNNDDFELVDFTITKEKYKTLKLNAQGTSYKQNTVTKNNTVTIQQRGKDNGIFIDYVFEKRKGLWFLKTWIDEST